ncbi:UDP-N-acetylglucosamine 1-carboxyvinyltransferase [Clostridium tarantellae]|uniref:UDP-N-acetylglucosamine 1-carboxyvinyltransferase n=1 Tax=Clostridium tarantellae TaxID=39493 RepID=A0A6I1MI22_9CLOT|nr:UDP-N-acetylglucosamine 1-carboxyvinyltransferase [Clostridium tarantellae]MPQ42544.1 UDP-N-acetylglucosamine 1-carboxyvinyltransferase [Clostridium tarantellae]
MDKIVVKGGRKLKGEVDISAAKNSVLPIIAASLLANGEVTINNAPMLEDVFTICDVINQLGFKVYINKNENIIKINGLNNNKLSPNTDLVRKMRASFLIMGPILAKYGECKIAQPGGCNIGSRPIELHLKGLKSLGAEIIKDDNGFILAKAKELIGNRVYLDFPSVGATENIMMAAVLAKGRTIIENAAQEPEISDLANFLIKLGAKINGIGCGKITIEGVSELKGTEYTPIFDRVEAGTFMIAAAITKSKIKINGINEEDLRPVIEKLKECGVTFEFIKGNIPSVIVKGNDIINPVDIKTLPHPGYPTDMQSQMMSLLSISNGNSIITESIFENRFMNVAELNRMGANIKVEGRTAFIEGVETLTGCEVRATDLRAGAALILAGLTAKGETYISDIYHIDRGYVNIEKKLKDLGAEIYRINS